MRLVALLALVLALVVPRAEAQRAAISRSGVLGGADYLIAVPENWRGGLVVFAHGIQRAADLEPHHRPRSRMDCVRLSRARVSAPPVHR